MKGDRFQPEDWPMLPHSEPESYPDDYKQKCECMSDRRIPINISYFENLLDTRGYHLSVDEQGFSLINVRIGNKTRLEADNYPDALFEAWNLIKPKS